MLGAGWLAPAQPGTAAPVASGPDGRRTDQPRPENTSAAYIFSYFVGNGEDGLHLAWSADGYNWESLNGGRSFLKPTVGESKLMRDPCLLLAPDGTFHLVWTTSWNGKTIGHATSRDLVQWSEPQAITVMEDPASLNCWAPEVFWDARKKQFLIFWASTITNRFLETAGQSEGKYNHRMYCTTTRDFKSFTPTRLFFDPGFNVIDATMVSANDRYYLVFKDETVKPPKKHLRIATSEHAEGPFAEPGPPFTRSWVEGPSVLKVGNEYVVYFDCYRDGHYGAMKSADLAHWEDVTSLLKMPRGVRHGTALAVPVGIVAALRAPPGVNEGFMPLFPEEGVPAGWVVRQWDDVSKPAADVVWRVKEGVLHGGEPRGTWLMSEKEYADFVLEFEWKLGDRGNSGTALRAPMAGDPAFDGMELQMADPRYMPTNSPMAPAELTGSLYRAVAPRVQVFKPEAWNRYEITCKGPFIKVVLNGDTILDLNLDEQHKTTRRHDGSEAPPLKDRPRKGHIGFQELSRGGGHVEIRNARIKVLDS